MDILFYVSQFGDNPFVLILTFMRNGGVFLFLLMLIYAAWKGWVSWVQNIYASNKKFVLLAIDVPRVNEQSMRAVEQIIATLHGVHQGPNKKELYWDGVIQDSFSLEIVSISGYIQYFVRCDDYNADLVKGAFFAQYPDAEIIEVEDYTQNVPQKYPDETMDLWGKEFVLANKSMYPIKTYEQFEHSLTGVFADPMAAILEVLSRLRPGEQVWLQLVITPVGSDWREDGVDEVNKLAGKVIAKKSRFGALGQIPGEFVDEFRRQAFALEGDGGSSSGGGSEADFNSLTRGEQLVIEEVQKKISRLAFDTKFRMLYIAPKDVMHGMRVVGSVFGSIKQFNTLDLNAFTGGKTSTSSPTYFNVERRKNRKKNDILRAYSNRDNWAGDTPYPMSTTELATLFHFPIDTVRAPLVARTVSKKSEPPTGLPLEMSSPFEELKNANAAAAAASAGPEPPTSSTLEGDGFAPQRQGDLPAALVVPAATAIPTPAEINPPAGGFPLHSMPGLPPGIVPIGQAAQPAQQQPQAPQSQPAQPYVAPAQPQPQFSQPNVVPPPEHFAPLQQQPQMQPHPAQLQMQQPQAPVQAPRVEPSHQAPQANKKGNLPPNLPIG